METSELAPTVFQVVKSTTLTLNFEKEQTREGLAGKERSKGDLGKVALVWGSLNNIHVKCESEWDRAGMNSQDFPGVQGKKKSSNRLQGWNRRRAVFLQSRQIICYFFFFLSFLFFFESFFFSFFLAMSASFQLRICNGDKQSDNQPISFSLSNQWLYIITIVNIILLIVKLKYVVW